MKPNIIIVEVSAGVTTTKTTSIHNYHYYCSKQTLQMLVLNNLIHAIHQHYYFHYHPPNLNAFTIHALNLLNNLLLHLLLDDGNLNPTSLTIIINTIKSISCSIINSITITTILSMPYSIMICYLFISYVL